MSTASHTPPAIVSKEEWLKARVDILNEEKALSKATAALAAKRRNLPWVLIPDYTLVGSDGPTQLSALFHGDVDTLIVYHMMMGTAATQPCEICSFFIDGFQGGLPHLAPRSSFAVVAKAPYAIMATACAAKEWQSVQLFSAGESTFNEDVGVSWTPEQAEAKDRPYNYGRQWPWGTEGPGLSVFKRDRSANGGAGAVYHSYSTFSAGLGSLSLVLSMLDLTPEGRGEEGGKNMWWVKHKEQY